MRFSWGNTVIAASVLRKLNEVIKGGKHDFSHALRNGGGH